MTRIRVGTRGSALALAQSAQIEAALRAAHRGVSVERVIVQTEGDRRRRASLLAIGGQGVFTRELELALLDGEIDVAVHSLKDLPSTVPDGLCVAATPPREDPRDLFISASHATLATLPEGARVGTGSLRRRAQLRALRPDLDMQDIRGNVDTRLAKLVRGEYEAIVLAVAGLNRLGIRDEQWGIKQGPLTSHPLSLDSMLPAPAQAIIGLECRSDDLTARSLLLALNHPPTFAAAAAERAVLRRFGVGCRLPLGAFATVEGGRLSLRARVSDPTGMGCLGRHRGGLCRRGGGTRGDGGGTAHRAGRARPAAGRAFLMSDLPLRGKRIVVTRARAQASELVERLRFLGAEPVEIPAIRIVPPADGYAALDAALRSPEGWDWVVFTSVNGVEHVWRRLPDALTARHPLGRARVAAIGRATAEALAERGVHVDLVPEHFVAESLLEALRGESVAGQRFLLPRAALAREMLREGLLAAGAEVTEVHAYDTESGKPDAEALRALESGVDALTFTSSSTVRNFVERLGVAPVQAMTRRATVAAIGPITAQTARELGLRVDLVAREYTIEGLLEALQEYFASHVSH